MPFLAIEAMPYDGVTILGLYTDLRKAKKRIKEFTKDLGEQFIECKHDKNIYYRPSDNYKVGYVIYKIELDKDIEL